MNTTPALIMVYIIGFFILYLLCRIFIKPVKWVLRLILSCCAGCGAMAILNRIFADWGALFEINPLTAMISGVLGVPGMIVAFILQGIL